MLVFSTVYHNETKGLLWIETPPIMLHPFIHTLLKPPEEGKEKMCSHCRQTLFLNTVPPRVL